MWSNNEIQLATVPPLDYDKSKSASSNNSDDEDKDLHRQPTVSLAG